MHAGKLRERSQSQTLVAAWYPIFFLVGWIHSKPARMFEDGVRQRDKEVGGAKFSRHARKLGTAEHGSSWYSMHDYGSG